MVQRVLDSHKDVTHVLTHDADTVPPADTILRLIKHNKDIIAGVYPIFAGGRKCWSFAMKEPVVKGDYSISQPLEPYGELPKKPFKVMALAGSTVLIKVDVFERKLHPWYFTPRIGSKPLMGHDFNFSNNARVRGYDLWVDPTVVCHHENTKDLLAIFNAE
jgi:GT2 family glycosyltransferase